MRIYLIGFMGAGKSLLGKRLAGKSGIPFIDLDTWIEKEAGMSIPDLFAKSGEEEFRRLEAECLRKTRSVNQAVVATGGGAPCFKQNMDWMNQNGITIYLKVPVDVLMERLKEEKAYRPLLAQMDDQALQSFISHKLEERSQFYEKAHFGYLGLGSVEEITDELARYLHRFLKQ